VSAGRREERLVAALGGTAPVGTAVPPRGEAPETRQTRASLSSHARPSAWRRLAAALGVAGLTLAFAGNGATARPAFLDGTLAPTAVSLATQTISTPTMQPVNVPARPVRVAVVPGTNGTEAWAIGYSSAVVPGWNSAGLGQAVFMHYTPTTGWQVTGPPLTSAGQPSPARLASISVAQGGEGWAVGADGVMVHHSPGSGEWRLASPVTGLPLTSVSVVSTPGGVTGYAVGMGLTVLRLAAGSQNWVADSGVSAVNQNVAAVDLASVSTVDADDAWAVSGDTATSLTVFHRQNGSWGTVSTEPLFDNPSASTTNQAASGGAITATGSGAWVVGRMEPTDQTHPLGDSTTGDRSRPFAIALTASGAGFTARSYCPTTVQIDSNSKQATETTVCDGDFPLAAFGLTGVSGFGDPDTGEAYATGMGLFHFTGGAWQREPDSVGYLSSLSMVSPVEGWMTGTGSNAITGAALSESIALGHWTEHPSVPAMARWPEPGTTPLEGAALSPDGSGVVMAVGGEGERVRFVPGFGWDSLPRGNAPMHALAWPAVGSAWAVGSDATMAHWDGVAWTQSKAPRNHFDDPMPALYGVAFADAGHGWAVGDDGVLLDYAGGWHRDPLSSRLSTKPLYAMAYGGGSAVAGGAGGTVLVARGTAWAVDGNASALAGAGSSNPATIYAAASLPDGTVVIGGTGGLLLERVPGGQFQRVDGASADPVDGTITALGLSRDSAGRLEILASVSPRATSKYVNGTLSTADGYLMVRDGSGWHDIELNHQLTMWTSTDAAAAHDPVYAIALQPAGLRGWAVGGYPAFTLDDDNLSSERETSSGSVYRVDATGDPNPPSSLTQLPPPPSSGFTFAFLGDSACAAGVCSAALGSGVKADVVLQEAQREIDMVKPDLTLVGGNMRGSGRTQELDVFKRYVQGFSMPVFGALGTQDLLTALNPNDVSSAAPSQQIGTTNTPYLGVFKDELQPWGDRSDAGTGVHPVAANSTGRTATHYAFDYQPPGLPAQVRFIVLNTSENTLAGTDENPNETQSTWLSSELGDAKSHGLQTVVVTSQPFEDPRTGTVTAAGATAEGDFNAAQAFPSAVFASTINDNTQSPLTVSTVPVTQYISGGAGSPLDGTKNSLHGYYHSWLLVTIDPDHRTSAGLATVQVKSMPVLDSVDMRLGTPAVAGTVPAGHPVQVYGLGRLPDAGIGNLNGASADPSSQSRADYVQFPPPYYGYFNCTKGTEGDTCTVPYAQEPYHKFSVEAQNPARPVAEFVKPCPSVFSPLWPCTDATGTIIPDTQGEYGFLCALNPGKVWVDVLMGVRVARQQVTVTSGSGFCNQHPIPEPPPAPQKAVEPQPAQPQPQTVPVVQPQAPQAVRVHHPTVHVVTNNPVAAVVPPPVPVLAAAPPLPAAGTAAKKEEERENAFEHSKESSGHQAVARADSAVGWDPRPVAGAGAALLLMLIMMSAWAVGRRDPETAIDVRRWE